MRIPMTRFTMQWWVITRKRRKGGEAGMPNWLKRCQQQISAHKIYERPIAMCTKCINTQELTLASFQESLVIDAWPNRYLSPWNMFAPLALMRDLKFIESGLMYIELKSFLATSEGQMTLIPLVTTKTFQKYSYKLKFVIFCGWDIWSNCLLT